VGDVQRIVAIENPVVRNLEITYCYSRLAAASTTRNGEGANWCTYATWASRQAGGTIRGEDLLENLGRRLGESLAGWLLHPVATLWRRLLRRGLFQRETRLGRLTNELHTPFDAFERASDAVARGNLKVFEEIGPQFARYLQGSSPEGERLLTQAFGHYEHLRREQDPPGGAPSSRCSRTWRSASTSRRACSRRSSRHSMPRTRRRRIWDGGRSKRSFLLRRVGGRSCEARPPLRSASRREGFSDLRADSRARR
jgi:hypothetical protein